MDKSYSNVNHDVTLSLHKKHLLSKELFKYLTFDTSSDNISSSNDRKTDTVTTNEIPSKKYLSQEENEQNVRYALSQIVDKYMSGELDDLISTITKDSYDGTKLDELAYKLTSTSSYLYILEIIKMSSRLLDDHTIIVTQKKDDKITTKKLKSLSLFDMMDANWSKDILSSDLLVELYNNNTDKLRAYKEILKSLQKVDDMEDLSYNWKEFNIVLRPSLSLDDLANEYYDIHYNLFMKCNDSNMQYDLIMNVLYSILSPTDIAINEDNIVYKSIKTLHKMLQAFYTKIKHLPEESIDTFYITLFLIFRFDGSVLHPLHLIALHDMYARWFSIYMKQIPVYQVLQHMVYTHFIHDIVHAASSTNVKVVCKPSSNTTEITKDELQYITHIHVLSIYKTIVTSIPLISLPWNDILQSKHHIKLTEEFIKNELKPIQDYRYLRIFANIKHEIDLDAMKRIVDPFISMLRYGSTNSIEYNDVIIDICYQPIQILLSYYSKEGNFTGLQELLIVVFEEILKSAPSHSTNHEILHSIESLLQVCDMSIHKVLVARKNKSDKNIAQSRRKESFINSLHDFIHTSTSIGKHLLPVSATYHQSIEEKHSQRLLIQDQFKVWLSLSSLLDSVHQYIKCTCSSCDEFSSFMVYNETWEDHLQWMKSRFDEYCEQNQLEYERGLF